MDMKRRQENGTMPTRKAHTPSAPLTPEKQTSTTPVSQTVTTALLAGGVSVLALTVAGRLFGTSIPAEIGLLIGGMTMIGGSFFIRQRLKAEFDDRLDIIVETLRAARNGEPVAKLDGMGTNGPFAEIAHLANDLMDIQAQVGAYHTQITSANDVLRLASETRKTLESDQAVLQQRMDALTTSANELSAALTDGGKSAATTMKALDGKSSDVLDGLSGAISAVKTLTADVNGVGRGVGREEIEDLQNRLHAVNAALATVKSNLDDGVAHIRSDIHASEERTNNHLSAQQDKQEAGHLVLETKLDGLKDTVAQTMGTWNNSQKETQSEHDALKSLVVETAAATHQMASDQEARTVRLENALTQSADATRAFIDDKISKAAEGHMQLRGEVRKTNGLIEQSAEETRAHFEKLNGTLENTDDRNDAVLVERINTMVSTTNRQASTVAHMADHMEIQTRVIESRFDEVRERLDRNNAELGRKIEHTANETMRSIPQISSLENISSLLAGQSDVLNLKLDDLAARLSKMSVALEAKPAAPVAVASSAPDPALEKLSEAFASLQGSFDAFSSDMRAGQMTPKQETFVVNQDGLTEFDATKGNFQNILVAFRVLLRQIGDQTAEYRDRVSNISAPAAPMSAEPTHTPEDTISPLLSSLVEKVSAMEAAMARGDGIEKPQETVRVETPDLSHLPDFSLDKTSLQHVLVGFRILLRDIQGEAQRLNQAVTLVEAAGASEPMPLANAQLAQSADNFEAYADRFTTLFDGSEQRIVDHMETAMAQLGANLAETISETESRLAAPLCAITSDIAESKRALDDLKAAIVEISIAPAPSNAPAPAVNQIGGTPSVTMAVNLMTAFSASMEARFNALDDTVSNITDQLQNGDETVEQSVVALAGELQASADAVRDQLNDFISVGAAISEELEKDRESENGPSQRAHR